MFIPLRLLPLLLAGLLLVACDSTPDEERIQQILDEIVQAVEAGELKDVAEHMHRDFRTLDGQNLQDVRRMLAAYSFQHSKIPVRRISAKTVLDPVQADRATTDMSVIVTAGGARGLPDDGSVRVVTLEWLKEGDWQIHRANWNN